MSRAQILELLARCYITALLRCAVHARGCAWPSGGFGDRQGASLRAATFHRAGGRACL